MRLKVRKDSFESFDLYCHCLENFLQFKWLHGGAHFVDKLPITSSGKIKRFEARAEAERLYKLRNC